jgi:hypothetical protein
VLGLGTRPVAFILSGMMAVAYWQFHAPHGMSPVQNQLHECSRRGRLECRCRASTKTLALRRFIKSWAASAASGGS